MENLCVHTTKSKRIFQMLLGYFIYVVVEKMEFLEKTPWDFSRRNGTPGHSRSRVTLMCTGTSTILCDQSEWSRIPTKQKIPFQYWIHIRTSVVIGVCFFGQGLCSLIRRLLVSDSKTLACCSTVTSIHICTARHFLADIPSVLLGRRRPDG